MSPARERLLVVRTMGLGDVACIGVPAARLLRTRHREAQITYLTFGVGAELLELVPEIDHVLALETSDWPEDIVAGLRTFAAHAEAIASHGFDRIVNLDTWFLPVVMARALRDGGVQVEGNLLNRSVAELTAQVNAGQLDQAAVSFPSRYMTSTFPNMESWSGAWWTQDPRPYPEFYLNHCCGLRGELDVSLSVPIEEQLLQRAEGRPVLALADRARTPGRTYPYGEALRRGLEEAGYFVWTGFDGSIPMARTLGRLRASELLVSVASAPQWLAAAVGCESLLIPGPSDPQPLGPRASIERFLDCQFCYQSQCVEGIDFECMKVAPEIVVERVKALLGAQR